MESRDLPMALVAFAALVMMVPSWVEHVNGLSVPPQETVLAMMVLPATLLLFITSWARPSAARPVVGLFMIGCFMVIAPELWALSGMAAGAVTSDSLSRLLLQVALPLILLFYIGGLGWRRVRGARR